VSYSGLLSAATTKFMEIKKGRKMIAPRDEGGMI
jgi:hypothetical protein